MPGAAGCPDGGRAVWPLLMCEAVVSSHIVRAPRRARAQLRPRGQCAAAVAGFSQISCSGRRPGQVGRVGRQRPRGTVTSATSAPSTASCSDR